MIILLLNTLRVFLSDVSVVHFIIVIVDICRQFNKYFAYIIHGNESFKKCISNFTVRWVKIKQKLNCCADYQDINDNDYNAGHFVDIWLLRSKYH